MVAGGPAGGLLDLAAAGMTAPLRSRPRLIVIAAGLSLVALAGCSQKDHGTQDAPPDQKYTDNSPAQVINFPDGFPNGALKCDHHGHLILVNTRDDMPMQWKDYKGCPDDWPAPEATP